MLRGFFVAGMNCALVGKRLEAIRNPVARRYSMVSALSSIFVREGSLVVFSSGGSVWVVVLSVAGSLVTFVCTRNAAYSVSPRTSAAH
jgi:cobalamin biosynthesis protein CobD/CbiB